MIENTLNLPAGARPDPDEFARAARERRINPETGSVLAAEAENAALADPGLRLGRDCGRGSDMTATMARTGQSTTDMLTQLLDVSGVHRVWVALAAFLLGAIARDALGDPGAAGRALDLAQPDQVLSIADAALISETAGLLARAYGPAPPPGRPAPGCQPLTHGETRVLNYLPTNLSAREIAGELYLSVNTVKTHQRHVYQKLDARNRTQAVEQARALGLLAMSARGRQ